ncbi:c-type cytochrome [Chryseobacterium indoltheticum]|uniref:Cytochrome c552 n=1 Tax=Chryseobacterium indoltheticum TaxID=254 RepID=A0A381FQY7_9FLAO|nr:c-type cytochrome [Chryseobacterium indoltheticum]SUX49029.1 Cytochrome c552 [Chryseobacterium indoltheticum]
MKQLFLTGIVSLLIISCSKKENSEIQPSSGTSTPVATNVSGKDLIEASDCMACHNAVERTIGPSYKEIAEKYSDKDIEMLASKIIEGGSGVWGSVPMQPHPQVSKEDAKKMVEFILSQKK